MNSRLPVIIIALLWPLLSCSQSMDPGAWMELPLTPESRSSDVYTLDMQVDGESQRNYTFLWDRSRMTADWVAYPLCRGNIGEGKRSNAFGRIRSCLKAFSPFSSRATGRGMLGFTPEVIRFRLQTVCPTRPMSRLSMAPI